MPSIRPPPLRPGDLVRVVAPSGPIDREVLERGIAVLRERFGLRVVARPDITVRHGYLAGDDSRRLSEWREAVTDPEARAVICARGGYGAMRLLPHLDPGSLLRAPKWFVGFSDTTAIHAALNQAGLVTVHGPMVSTLGRATGTARSIEHLQALLFEPPGGGERPEREDGAILPGRGCLGAGTIRPGRASGVLLGGSLTLLAHLCGSRWTPRLAGAVLFFEDVDEKPYRLDRYLTQLQLAGALEGVQGVCVGQLTACDDGAARGIDTVRDIVRGLGVPAIEGIAAGHEEPNLALPLGSRVRLIAPASPEEGPPRLLFDGDAAA